MLSREALIHKRLSIVLENESLSTKYIHHLKALKKVLTENKDNLASAYTDFKMDENIQKLIDSVYESANTDMGEYSMSFMKMFDIFSRNADTIPLKTWMNISCLFVLCYRECPRTTIMIMVNGSQIIGQ